MTSQHNEIATKPHHLCRRCVTSCLSTLLPTGPDSPNDLIEIGLGSPSTWDLRNCDFCQFLFQCLPQSYRTEAAPHDVIRIVLPTKEKLTEEAGVIARVLDYSRLDKRNLRVELHPASGTAITHSAVVLLDNQVWAGLKPTSPMVDFAMLTKWLALPAPANLAPPRRRKAMGSNRSLRDKPSRTDSWETARIRVHEMELTVIDCTTRHLVRLPLENHYVTLSYVWGKAMGQIRRGTPRRPDSTLGGLRLAGTDKSGESDKAAALPTNPPLTIEDSLRVCKALDYRYLWIDRYCIPQSDRQLRARQLQQMDDIYCGSALTIIACAGAGPQYGLPGVSRPRTPCPSIRNRRSEFMQMIPTVHDIYSSTWASRAWTYQEALLAQRRLFFTDRQVYFESNDVVESELTTLTSVITRVLDPRIYSQVTSSAFPGDIHKCIQEYSRRKLSFQSDVLNALLGILTYYGREHKTLHLWGMPFSKATPASSDEPPRKGVITLEESLCWYPKGPHVRVEGFPSWSWAGWASAVTWDIWRHDLKPASAPLTQGLVSVQVELNSGQILSWADYQARYAEFNDSSSPSDRPSRFIHVKTFVSKIMYRSDQKNSAETTSWRSLGLETDDGTSPLAFNLFSNPAAAVDENPGDFTVWAPESLLVLHLSSRHENKKSAAGTILVVEDKGGHWERVALLDDEEGILHRAKRTWMTVRLG
jgi:hypothetical protein